MATTEKNSSTKSETTHERHPDAPPIGLNTLERLGHPDLQFDYEGNLYQFGERVLPELEYNVFAQNVLNRTTGKPVKIVERNPSNTATELVHRASAQRKESNRQREAQATERPSASSVFDSVQPIRNEYSTMKQSIEYLMHDSDGRGLIERGTVNALVGEGGAGKTYLLIDLILTASTARGMFLNHFQVSPRKVLYIASEDLLIQNSKLFTNRMIDWYKQRIDTEKEREPAFERERENLHWLNPEFSLIQSTRTDEFKPAKLARQIGEFTERYSDALIVIDGLVRILKANESNHAFMAAIEALETEKSPSSTVLLAHHTNKIARFNNITTSAASRGGSVFTDLIRTEFNLSGSETKTLKVVKSNHYPHTSWKLEYCNGVFNTIDGEKANAESIENAAHELADLPEIKNGEGLPIREIAKLCKVSDGPIHILQKRHKEVIDFAEQKLGLRLLENGRYGLPF